MVSFARVSLECNSQERKCDARKGLILRFSSLYHGPDDGVR
jgi:hypothetical protein